MTTVTLIRTSTGPAGTFGTLALDDGSNWRSGELPERDNVPDRSCIPPGNYACALFDSPKHGPVYLLAGVPGRSGIEIHIANFCGDVDDGMKCDLLGCICLGLTVGMLEGQLAVQASTAAFGQFMSRMRGQPFRLAIIERFS